MAYIYWYTGGFPAVRMWLDKVDSLLYAVPVSKLLKGGLYSKMRLRTPLGCFK